MARSDLIGCRRIRIVLNEKAKVGTEPISPWLLGRHVAKQSKIQVQGVITVQAESASLGGGRTAERDS